MKDDIKSLVEAYITAKTNLLLRLGCTRSDCAIEDMKVFYWFTRGYNEEVAYAKSKADFEVLENYSQEVKHIYRTNDVTAFETYDRDLMIFDNAKRIDLEDE